VPFSFAVSARADAKKRAPLAESSQTPR